MFCNNCGKELPEDSNFCMNCGKAAKKKEGGDSYFSPYNTSEETRPGSANKGTGSTSNNSSSGTNNNGFGGDGNTFTSGSGSGYSRSYSYRERDRDRDHDRAGTRENSGESTAAYAVLGFFFPIIGLILFLIWKDEYPGRARSAGKGALISVIISAVVGVIAGIIISIYMSEFAAYYSFAAAII